MPLHLLRPFILLLAILCSIGASESLARQALAQKLADKPKDRALVVAMQGQKLCYTPSHNAITLEPCTNATPLARYDVFARVAWFINNAWLCMSVADNEVDIVLKPCVLNDTKQRFVLRDSAFYTQDKSLQVATKGKVVALATKGATPHTLDSSMQEWASTLATPAGLNISTFIGWSFITPSGFDMYYLANAASIKDSPRDFIYNPETKQLALFDTHALKLTCLASTQTSKQEWNWLAYKECAKGQKSQQWEIFAFGENNQAMLKDYLGNFLRVTKYGVNWGVPYTATSAYIAKDTYNTPTSFFHFDNAMQDWQRFVEANISKELASCPAPGSSARPSLKNPPLPSHFTLNDAWKRRLWQIATSTDGVLLRAGDCGVCLLHSYQIVAELITYAQAPLESGGYFFDTQAGANPFPSFRTRYPLLASQLESYTMANAPSTQSWADAAVYATQVYRSIALSMFPGYFWTMQEYARTQIEMLNILQGFFNAPVGSVWIINVYMRDAQGRASGHAIPVLRLEQGVLFIPTNVTGGISYEAFSGLLSNTLMATTLQEAINALSTQGIANIYMFAALRLREPYRNPLNTEISSNNCSGDGDGRRGSGVLPLSQAINQCASGRCLIQ